MKIIILLLSPFLFSFSVYGSDTEPSKDCPDFQNKQVYTCHLSTGERRTETVKIKLREGVKSFQFETSLSVGFGYSYLFIPDGKKREARHESRIAKDTYPYEYRSYNFDYEKTFCTDNKVRKERAFNDGGWVWISERGLDESGKLIKRDLLEIRNLNNLSEVFYSEERKNICYPEND